MTVDIYIYPSPEEQQRLGGKPYSFLFNRTLRVGGLQKMMNRWAKCFLTAKGTDPLRPNYGTDYPKLYGANVFDSTILEEIVVLAVEDASAQMKAMDEERLPPEDERFFSAELVQFTASDDGFDAYVLLRNYEKRSAALLLPTGQVL